MAKYPKKASQFFDIEVKNSRMEGSFIEEYKVSERFLLINLKAGKPDAVSFWFKSFYPPVMQFVKKKVEKVSDAEEIVQEIFINALRQLPLFRGESSLMTWMLSIARHEVADFFRKKYAKKVIKSLPLQDTLIQTVVPTKIYNSHETAEKVKAVIATLTAPQQELLLLKYIDNKKVEEIAAELGRTVKSVESELFRARRAFRLAFSDQENE